MIKLLAYQPTKSTKNFVDIWMDLSCVKLANQGRGNTWIENSWAVCHLCNAQITL